MGDPGKFKKKIGKKHKTDPKVKEVADAIRRDHPGITDEQAYRISWEQKCSVIDPSYPGCGPKGKSQRKSPKSEYAYTKKELHGRPPKVKEIADAIRRDYPETTDEAANRIAWENFCSYIEPGYEGCTEKGKSKRESPKPYEKSSSLKRAQVEEFEDFHHLLSMVAVASEGNATLNEIDRFLAHLDPNEQRQTKKDLADYLVGKFEREVEEFIGEDVTEENWEQLFEGYVADDDILEGTPFEWMMKNRLSRKYGGRPFGERLTEEELESTPSAEELQWLYEQPSKEREARRRLHLLVKQALKKVAAGAPLDPQQKQELADKLKRMRSPYPKFADQILSILANLPGDPNLDNFDEVVVHLDPAKQKQLKEDLVDYIIERFCLDHRRGYATGTSVDIDPNNWEDLYNDWIAGNSKDPWRGYDLTEHTEFDTLVRERLKDRFGTGPVGSTPVTPDPDVDPHDIQPGESSRDWFNRIMSEGF